MYTLKGFYEFPAFIDNSSDTVAVLGEISDNSLTYAKDKTIHTSATSPNVGLISFHSVRDETVVDVSTTIGDQVLKLGNYLVTQAIAGTITNNADALRQMVMAEFSTTISSFTTGTMKTNGSQWLPEYVQVVFIDTVDTTNTVTIWMSDDSFAAQYDEYIIQIVHPLVPYDNFFLDPLVVKTSLAAYSIVDKLAEVQALRAQYPYTYQQAFQFDYVNPSDTTQKYSATWIAIIYGVAGNNPDLIKDQIVSDLLGSTTHTRDEWQTILPDLFLTTEFIFTPLWDQYSVGNRDFRSGIYSPVIDPRKRLELIKRTARGPGYNDTWTISNYELSANIYKSLAFAALGNPQNRNSVTSFVAQFPDYMIVETDSADASRMDPVTLEWMSLFSKLIVAAETMTQYTSVPTGISRMTRDGVIYASAFYKSVNYLVVTKGSVETILT